MHTPLVHLTIKERKKLRRLAKAEKLRDTQDKIKLGIIDPPPQKIKLNKMMNILSSALAADPTKTEEEILAKYNQR